MLYYSKKKFDNLGTEKKIKPKTQNSISCRFIQGIYIILAAHNIHSYTWRGSSKVNEILDFEAILIY